MKKMNWKNKNKTKQNNTACEERALYRFYMFSNEYHVKVKIYATTIVTILFSVCKHDTPFKHNIYR